MRLWLSASSGDKTSGRRQQTPASRRANLVTLGVQAVIVTAAQKVLMVRHGYRPGWHFPGGGVETDETIEYALARELEEETGVQLTQQPQIFGIYSHFEQFPGDHIIVFLARHWTQPQVPPPNNEIVEQGFFDINALPDGSSIGSLRRIAEIFDGLPRADNW